MRTNSPSLSSLVSSNAGTSSAASSTLQEGDGVRKSGQIVLLNSNKKKGNSMYAVLSERALELHESEKAQRKKKGTKSIVDLSKCFNVSQQTCPKSRSDCVCLLMPDECFAFRGENSAETSDWYSSLLFAVISARALRLGRPVFPNEFFECVWDVTVWPTQPKLKMLPQNPDNSPNICAKLQNLNLKGKKRLCFYPHTIILSNVGIEPAFNGLPKSGIPPFRTTEFVEFSRHYIASFGSQEKFFIMRIGRGSPMGSCEAWIQCESEETAAEVKNKLADIIRREAEKKQCALLAFGNIAKGSSSANNGAAGVAQQRAAHYHHHHSSGPSSSTTTANMAPSTANGSVAAVGGPLPPQQLDSAARTLPRSDAVVVASVVVGSVAYQQQQQNRSPELETISEDEQQQLHQQQQQQQFPGAEQRSPATSVSSASNGGGGGGAAGVQQLQQQQRNNSNNKHHHGHAHHHHHSSSLSQSAREKRLELRECKAKVDSLEEEEQRFREQHSCASGADARWRQLLNWTTSSSANGVVDEHRPPVVVAGGGAAAGGRCTTGGGGAMLPHSQSRPAYLGYPPPEGKLFRRRGSATSMDTSALRSKSTSLEQQQMPLSAGRNWSRKPSPMDLNNNDNNNNNGINDFDIRWINRTDSLNMLGAGAMGSNFFYGAEEETEDSGGTLRIPCGDGEDNNSQENSRSASSLNLAAVAAAAQSSAATTALSDASTSGGDIRAAGGGGFVVEALVECHATAGDLSDLSDEPHVQQQQQLAASLGNGSADDGPSTEEEEAESGDAKMHLQRIDLAAVRRRRKKQQHPPQQQQQRRHDESVVEQQQQQHRRRQQQMLMMATATASSSQEAAEEADQSCCSSSIASSSSVTCREEDVAAALQSRDGTQLVTAAATGAEHQCHHHPPPVPLSSTELAAADQLPLAQKAMASADDHHQHQQQQHHDEYTIMDKVSCSSDSFSHLAVPQQWDRQYSSIGGCCQEEICSCASDSGDSCYSSMANGQLNPRAFSFSSATDGSAGSGGGAASAVISASSSACAAAARTAAAAASGRVSGRAEGRHWTMGGGAVAGMALHRNCGANGNNCHLVHFSSPRAHQQMPSSSAAVLATAAGLLNCSNMMMHHHHFSNTANCWPPPDSSSSSRFSMETSLITPLEEDEKQVSLCDEEERDKLCTEMNQRAGNELRKRAFSLGSKSWITKPFRKLSSSAHHGGSAASSSSSTAAAAALQCHHHQQQHHRPHHQQKHSNCAESATARSCTSSLTGSMHADLQSAAAAPAAADQQQQQQHNSGSQNRLSHRLGSSSSFASCSIAGHQDRSDSVGSSHSVAFSLPGGTSLTQKLLRKKQPSDDHLRSDDLVELEFLAPQKPNGTAATAPNLIQHGALMAATANRSTQCVPSTVSNEDALRSSTRARTSSCDDHNSQPHGGTLHQLQQAMSTPLGMGSRASVSSALDNIGRHQQHQHHNQQQWHNHHLRGWAESGDGKRNSCCASQDNFTMCQQQQRLRPSESFIRSIQQQQKELQQQQQLRNHNNNNSRQQKRHKTKSDFPLQEVQCFIAPAEREKIDAVTSSSRGSDRDSLSMRSQRSGSGSTFETIQECAAAASAPSIGPKRADSRTSNQRQSGNNSSRPPSSFALAADGGAHLQHHLQQRQQQAKKGVDDDEYVVLSAAESAH